MKTQRTILIALATILLASCVGNTSKLQLTYDHPERYSMGDATIEQTVHKISIDWYEGLVSIRHGDAFRISEESDSALTDSLRMRYFLDGDGELKIRYCQSGSYRHEQLRNLNKWLKIEVPRDVRLDEIDIDMVGNMLTIDSVWCHELNVNAVNVAATLHYVTLPDEIDLDGVNTTLRLYVPPTAGLTIDMDAVNTSLDSELPVRKEGKKTTIVGDGRCQVDIDAVNGEVYINEIK